MILGSVAERFELEKSLPVLMTGMLRQGLGPPAFRLRYERSKRYIVINYETPMYFLFVK